MCNCRMISRYNSMLAIYYCFYIYDKINIFFSQYIQNLKKKKKNYEKGLGLPINSPKILKKAVFYDDSCFH